MMTSTVMFHTVGRVCCSVTKHGGSNTCCVDMDVKYASLMRHTRFLDMLCPFFVCVRTNVNYSIVASFIVQLEDSSCIAEALQILQDWNPDWHPVHQMVDFSEADINALQSVFKGNAFLSLCSTALTFTSTILLWSSAQCPTGGPRIA